ncbi:MAG: PadR family transcriptional regulator [Mangrovibacterium sp.]
MKSISRELIGASAALIILTVLTKGDSYGYEIVMKVKSLSNNEIKWQVAGIYPVLKKLEDNNMIKSYWKVQADQRPRRYYSIEADGKKQLEQNMRDWNMVQSVINAVRNE